MSNETWAQNPFLHTLIPLADFKALLGIDDREDCLDFASVRNQGYEFLHGKNSTNLFQPPSLAAFYLITATYAIEQYCKRQLLKKKHYEMFDFMGDYVFPLRDYPVRKIVSISSEQRAMSKGGLIGAEFYRVIPDCGDLEDVPPCLWVSPALRLIRGASILKVRYVSGYSAGRVPPDLGSACLELAAWNMSRYRGRKIGMAGAEGEHLEGSMPENVRQLLEPYRRKTI